MDKKEEARRRWKERTAKKRFKLPEGDTTFRVLPNKKGLNFREYVEYAMHSEIGPRKSYLRCGKSAKGEGECWLCDVVIPKLEKSGKSSHRQVAERMQRKESFAVQIAYKDEDDRWIGPVLWEMPNSIANGLLGIMGRRDISHPEKGYNLTISRTGTGLRDTKYGQLDRDDEPSEVSEKILERLKPFAEVVRKYDEEGMKAAYYGHEQEEEPEEEEKEKEREEEEEEKPKAKKGRREEEEPELADEDEEKPKGKKKEEEEEDLEPPEEEDLEKELEEFEEGVEDVPDLEEDQEEKSRKGKKKEEEEENEEKPKSKKGRREEEEEAPAPKKGKKSRNEVKDEDF